MRPEPLSAVWTARTARRAARHVISLGLAALFVLPLVWTMAASLRQPGLPPPRTMEWLPQPAAWDNYLRIFDTAQAVPLGRYALNSLLVSALAVPLTLLTASWAGFALSQMPDLWRRRLAALTLGLLMVPVTALWLTRFVLFTWSGLVNTYGALLAPVFMGSSPLFVLLFYWAFRRLPRELFESARLEGAGVLTLWRRVALPQAGPTLAAAGVLTFILYWSDFINPLLYLKSQWLYTLPVGLRQLQQLDTTHWPLLLAASVVLTAPAVFVFLIAQYFFLRDDWFASLRRPLES
jgi:multiple sugar transport system permease protein